MVLLLKTVGLTVSGNGPAAKLMRSPAARGNSVLVAEQEVAPAAELLVRLMVQARGVMLGVWVDES